MLTLYLFFIVFLLIIISILAYKLYQFSLVILGLEDAIEECLDQLDERYQSVGKILQQEIFFDSIEVRQVISDIKQAHTSILQIANKLTNIPKVRSEIKEKNNKEKNNKEK